MAIINSAAPPSAQTEQDQIRANLNMAVMTAAQIDAHLAALRDNPTQGGELAQAILANKDFFTQRLLPRLNEARHTELLAMHDGAAAAASALPSAGEIYLYTRMNEKTLPERKTALAAAMQRTAASKARLQGMCEMQQLAQKNFAALMQTATAPAHLLAGTQQQLTQIRDQIPLLMQAVEANTAAHKARMHDYNQVIIDQVPLMERAVEIEMGYKNPSPFRARIIAGYHRAMSFKFMDTYQTDPTKITADFSQEFLAWMDKYNQDIWVILAADEAFPLGTEETPSYTMMKNYIDILHLYKGFWLQRNFNAMTQLRDFIVDAVQTDQLDLTAANRVELAVFFANPIFAQLQEAPLGDISSPHEMMRAIQLLKEGNLIQNFIAILGHIDQAKNPMIAQMLTSLNASQAFLDQFDTKVPNLVKNYGDHKANISNAQFHHYMAGIFMQSQLGAFDDLMARTAYGKAVELGRLESMNHYLKLMLANSDWDEHMNVSFKEQVEYLQSENPVLFGTGKSRGLDRATFSTDELANARTAVNGLKGMSFDAYFMQFEERLDLMGIKGDALLEARAAHHHNFCDAKLSAYMIDYFNLLQDQKMQTGGAGRDNPKIQNAVLALDGIRQLAATESHMASDIFALIHDMITLTTGARQLDKRDAERMIMLAIGMRREMLKPDNEISEKKRQYYHNLANAFQNTKLTRVPTNDEGASFEIDLVKMIPPFALYQLIGITHGPTTLFEALKAVTQFDDNTKIEDYNQILYQLLMDPIFKNLLRAQGSDPMKVFRDLIEKMVQKPGYRLTGAPAPAEDEIPYPLELSVQLAHASEGVKQIFEGLEQTQLERLAGLMFVAEEDIEDEYRRRLEIPATAPQEFSQLHRLMDKMLSQIPQDLGPLSVAACEKRLRRYMLFAMYDLNTRQPKYKDADEALEALAKDQNYQIHKARRDQARDRFGSTEDSASAAGSVTS